MKMSSLLCLILWIYAINEHIAVDFIGVDLCVQWKTFGIVFSTFCFGIFSLITLLLYFTPPDRAICHLTSSLEVNSRTFALCMCPVLEGLLNKILQIINTLRKVMILKQFYKKKKKHALLIKMWILLWNTKSSNSAIIFFEVIIECDFLNIFNEKTASNQVQIHDYTDDISNSGWTKPNLSTVTFDGHWRTSLCPKGASKCHQWFSENTQIWSGSTKTELWMTWFCCCC